MIRPARPNQRLRPSEAARLRQRQATAPTPLPSGGFHRGDRPRGWSSGPGLPVEWWRTTMAYLCSVYPFHADAPFGERAVHHDTLDARAHLHATKWLNLTIELIGLRHRCRSNVHDGPEWV